MSMLLTVASTGSGKLTKPAHTSSIRRGKEQLKYFDCKKIKSIQKIYLMSYNIIEVTLT